MAPSIPPRVLGQGEDDQGWLGKVMSKGLGITGRGWHVPWEVSQAGSIRQVPGAEEVEV